MQAKKGQEGFNPVFRTIIVFILVLLLISAISFILFSYIKGIFGGAQ